MGRPIKGKWFTVRDQAGWTGDLTVLTTAGAEPIIKQVGTGVYIVASGRVKLIDGAPAVAAAPGVTGDASLQFDGDYVWKVNQYRMYFFDPLLDSVQWRDNSNPPAILGTLTPPLTAEGALDQATATVTVLSGAVSAYNITNNGANYVGAPVVTVSAPNPVTATATATVTAAAISAYNVTLAGGGYTVVPAVTVGAPDGTSATTASLYVGDAAGVGTVAVDVPGGGYAVAPVVTQSGGPGTGGAFTATIDASGSVTGIVGSGGGASYAGDETFTLAAVVLTQETATATLTTGTVTGIATNVAGVGYVAAPTVTIDAPVSTQATATAVLTGDAVTSITNDVPGAGYVSATVVIAAP